MAWLTTRLAMVCVLAVGARAAVAQTCVQARVDGERAYFQCVNDELARLALMAHSSLGMNTLDATSPAPKIGTFNRTATAERMGNAFGHSVISQRPAAPFFAAPLLPGKP